MKVNLVGSLAFGFVLLSGFPQTGQAEVLSVCQLVSEPERFAGKWVTVMGRVLRARHVGRIVRDVSESGCDRLSLISPPGALNYSLPPRFALVRDRNYREMSESVMRAWIPPPDARDENLQVLALLQGRFDSIYRLVHGNRSRNLWVLGNLTLASPPAHGLVLHRVVASETVSSKRWVKDGPTIIDSMTKTQVDPSPQSEDGWTPLHYAVRKNNAAGIAELVKAGANPNTQAKDGRTPLHLAALDSDNPAIITALVKAGADPNAPSQSDRAALHLAAGFNGNPLITKALIDMGADPMAKTEDGWTSLHFSAMHNRNASITASLVKAGSDPNAVGEFASEGNFTPLHLAAALNSNPSVVGVLIGAGADLTAWSENGLTSLDLAALENGNPDIIDALVRAGTDPKVRSECGSYALDYAVSNNNPTVVTALLLAGYEVRTREVRIQFGSCEALNDVSLYHPLVYMTLMDFFLAGIAGSVDSEVDPEGEQDYSHLPHLHIAAALNGNPEVINTLLEAGADPKVRSENGFSPLHFAATTNFNPAVVKTLVKAGADPNARSENGFTPLHFAVASGQDFSVPMIAALRDVGADPKIPNDEGKLPWDYVQENPILKDTEIYRWLKEASSSGMAE